MLKYLFNFKDETEALKQELYNINNEKKYIEKKYKECLEEIKELRTELNLDIGSDDSCDEYQSSFTQLLINKKKMLKKTKPLKIQKLHQDIIDKKFKLKKNPIKNNKKVLHINDNILQMSLLKLRKTIVYSEPNTPTNTPT
jgi:hypothetical protein